MKSERICALVLAALLCLISVPGVVSISRTAPPIHSHGSILDPNMEIITVGFDIPEDFLTPESGPEVWASQQSYWTMRDSNSTGMYFELATDIVHSGTQSARLALTNPIDYDHSRIHIYHEWGDLVNETDIWTEAWYYFPVDFVVDEWVQFHTALSEKYLTRLGPVHWLAVGVGFSNTPYYKVSDTEWRLGYTRHQGWIDENNDKVNDLPPFTASDWVRFEDSIKFGEWFKLTTYIHRDRDPTQGIVRMWLNDKLQVDVRQRTAGFNPLAVDATVWGGDGVTLVRDLPRTGGQQRYLFNSGISLYTGDHPATPKRIYVDDVMLKHLLPSV